MQASNAPTKIQIPFANSGAKNTIPIESQIGVTPGLASYTTGFPPLTMTQVVAGGVPPYGQDVNGILNAITAIQQWQSGGGMFKYDSVWSAANSGYAAGALLVRADNGGLWFNLVDGNTTDPDAGPSASWGGVALLASPQFSGSPTAPTPAAGDISTKIATTEFVQSAASGGQCRLSVASPTSLTLLPFNGNQIIVGGYARQIPPGGVSISNSGLPANALRYVYAYSSSGAIALELSSTGHSVGPNGVEVKNGDASRSLVGMIYTTASSQFADSPTQRLCANWFNRRLRAGVATLLVDTNFSTVVSSEITASLRVSALYWSNSGAYSLIANGSVSNNTAGGIAGFEGRINGGVFGTEARSTFSAAGAYECLVSASHSENIAEGLITATAYGYVSSGSVATLYGTATVNLTVNS